MQRHRRVQRKPRRAVLRPSAGSGPGRISRALWGMFAFSGLLLASCGPVLQAAEADSPPSPAALVEQLGSTEFAEREAAAEALMQWGLASREALEAGRKHVDREIRFRSARILAILQRTEFRRQLDAFLSNGAGQPDLPGWDRFREQFEDSPGNRRLFVEMQRSEPELLAAIERGTGPATDAINARCEQLQNSLRAFRSEISIGSVASLLFLAGEPEVRVDPIASATLYSCCYQDPFRGSVMGGAQKEALRKLLGRWVQNGQSATPYQLLHLAMNYDLQEGVEPAERVLRDVSSAPHVLQYGLLTLAKLGSKEHIPLIEPFLVNQEPCGGSQNINNVVFQTRVCDVALATLVELAGQNHQDFGFDERFERNEQIAFNPSSLGFAEEDKRAAAIAKWREYRSRQGAEPADAPGGDDADADSN